MHMKGMTFSDCICLLMCESVKRISVSREFYWRETGLWQAKQTKNNQTAIIRSQRVAIASLLLR